MARFANAVEHALPPAAKRHRKEILLGLKQCGKVSYRHSQRQRLAIDRTSLSDPVRLQVSCDESRRHVDIVVEEDEQRAARGRRPGVPRRGSAPGGQIQDAKFGAAGKATDRFHRTVHTPVCCNHNLEQLGG